MENNQTILFNEKDEPRDFYFDHCFWSHDVFNLKKGFTFNSNGIAVGLNEKYAD